MQKDGSKMSEGNVYSFLYPSEHREVERIPLLGRIQNVMQNTPDTSATLSLDTLSVTDRSAINKQLMWFCGSWVMPERYRTNSNKRVYINPNYAHKKRFSDCKTECRCGAVQTHTSESNQIEGQLSEHTDACKLYWRRESDARLLRKREQIIRSGLYYTHNFADIAPRLGMEPDAARRCYQMCGGSIRSQKAIGTSAFDRTVYELRQYYTLTELSRAFGYSKNTLSKYSTRYGRDKSDPLDLLQAV